MKDTERWILSSIKLRLGGLGFDVERLGRWLRIATYHVYGLDCLLLGGCSIDGLRQGYPGRKQCS